MDNEKIHLIVPIKVVKKYFPLLFRHPRSYWILYHFKVLDTFFSSMYLMFSLFILFLLALYFLISKSQIMARLIIQSNLIQVLAILFLCATSLLFMEARSKKIVKDTSILKRLLVDKHLIKENKLSHIDIDALIPILAIKRYKDEQEEVTWLALLPKKVSSSERSIKRLKSEYKINDSYLLDNSERYKEWIFEVKENKLIGKLLGILWIDLLKFEIEILEMQKR